MMQPEMADVRSISVIIYSFCNFHPFSRSDFHSIFAFGMSDTHTHTHARARVYFYFTWKSLTSWCRRDVANFVRLRFVVPSRAWHVRRISPAQIQAT